MFESSKDILYLVLAFCVFWFTAFVCWALYYVISMLRDASKAVGEVRDKLHAIDQAIRNMKEKLEHSAGYLGVIAAAFKALIEYLERHKEKVAEKAAEAVAKAAKGVKKAKERMKEAVEDMSEE